MSERSKFAAICFDCDSTLTRIEGIDELARRAGVVAEIAPLTTAAMDGTLALDEIYAKRLEIVRPDGDALAWLGARYVEEMVDGALETIAALQAIGKPTYLVSGGFLQPVATLARAIGIDVSNVRAVEIYLDDSGRYAGFDASSPLTRSDGKAEICRAVAEHHGSVAIVGDGMTDLAARAAGAYVVGFGGVARRRVMVEGADCFVAEAPLTRTLDALLSSTELQEARRATGARSVSTRS
ncbi:MAG: HAD-IB family phosphatase [Hyphomicrobium sp.]|nr:HAD-IB family phosphatase [Hyphomicrobium sp.]